MVISAVIFFPDGLELKPPGLQVETVIELPLGISAITECTAPPLQRVNELLECFSMSVALMRIDWRVKAPVLVMRKFAA